MSSGSTSDRTQTLVIARLRRLIERNMTERAITLADSHWPGSGQFVRVAAEWAALTPQQRRERLAAMSPEDLAQLRAVASLQPDLARVLDELVERGLIPPAPTGGATELAAVLDRAEGSGVTIPEPLYTLSEQLDGSDEVSTHVASTPPPAPPVTTPEDSDMDPADDTLVDPFIGRIDLSSPVVRFEPGATQAFTEQVTERRQAAVDHGRATLDRIQQRAQDLAERAANSAANWPTLNTPTDSPRLSADDPTDRRAAPDQRQMDAARVADLAADVMSSKVLEMDADDYSSTAAAAVASERGVPFFELSAYDLGRTAFFGNLRRQGRTVMTDVGAFPQALSGPALVVVHGLLYPAQIARLREGFCDIPGTRSTTRVHPEARVIVVN